VRYVNALYKYLYKVFPVDMGVRQCDMVAAVPVRALQQEIFKTSGRAIVNVPKSDTQNAGGICCSIL